MTNPKIIKHETIVERWSTVTTNSENWSGGSTREEAIANHFEGVESRRKQIERWPFLADALPEMATGTIPIVGLRRTISRTVYEYTEYPIEPYEGEQPPP